MSLAPPNIEALQKNSSHLKFTAISNNTEIVKINWSNELKNSINYFNPPRFLIVEVNL